MKKLFTSFILVFVLFAGCAPTQKVDTFTFSIGEEVSNIVLTVTPDYGKRELNISYAHKDIATTKGAIGGDYFDRFQDLVKWFYQDDVKDTSKGDVKLSALSEAGNKEVVIDWNSDLEDLDVTQDFYTDVISLFSEDVY